MPLHPQSEAFLQQARLANAPAWYEMPVQQARETFSRLPLFGEAPELAIVEDRTVAGVPVRTYRHQATAAASDVIVYFHGGGWVLGNINTHDALCRRIAKASGATVVSVDYRNPPEHPFPAAADDCYAVCQSLAGDASPLKCSGRMVVAGDSAGGNLAMAVALQARDGGPPICGQMLIYPVLDSTMSSESYQRYAEGFGLTRETMAWFWQIYTGDTETGLRNDPRASPLAANDLGGLPETHVLTAEYDVLRDEGLEMVRRLADAGVPTTHHEQAGMLHGFIHFAGAFDAAIAATLAVGRRCRDMLQGDGN